MPPSRQSQRDEIAEAYQAYLDAMHDGDTSALDELLDNAFTLTHITGYVQPKAEWLAEIRAGRFTYHAISDSTTSRSTPQGTPRALSAGSSPTHGLRTPRRLAAHAEHGLPTQR